MKTTFLIAIASLCCFGTYAQTKKPVKKKAKAPAPLVLKNNLDSTSYAYGVGLIKDMKNRGITTLNYTALNRAISDGIADKKINLTPEQSKAIISTHYVLKFAANAVAGNAFIAANKSKPGIIPLPSGLQYTVLTEAVGPKPTLTDTAYVNYIGTLTDGKKFDSNDDGKPFKTVPTAVIKGWTEGLQLMSPGAKYRFYIPYQLAYGDRSFEGTIIVPYSTLVFDIELLKIVPKK